MTARACCCISRSTSCWARTSTARSIAGREMFLPEELSRGLASVRVPGPAGERPLVASRSVLSHTTRSPPLQSPPRRIVPFLLAGLGVGLLFAGPGLVRVRRGRSSRVLFGLLVAVWGFVVGFIGCFLLYAWCSPITSSPTETRTSFSSRPGRSRCRSWASAWPWAGGGRGAAFWLRGAGGRGEPGRLPAQARARRHQAERAADRASVASWIGAAVALRSLSRRAMITASEARGRSRP